MEVQKITNSSNYPRDINFEYYMKNEIYKKPCYLILKSNKRKKGHENHYE